MRILIKFWIYVFLILVVIVESKSILFAQEEAVRLKNPAIPHPVADEAISRLKSPYCPGLMLEVCTSYQGALLRDSLQAMAREGKNTEDLVNWVLANHGEEYLAYPDMSGRGLLAWVVPPGVLILGIGIVIVTLRYMKDPIGTKAGVEREFSDEDEIWLREALKEMDVEEGPIF
tara:strand:+ start:220 stop:741 length:522 start_codon:yes stop_codon:yes gene_type:complete